MKKSHKIYIIIIVVYLIIATIALGYHNLYVAKNKGYIIFSSDNIYYKNNKKITKYTDSISKLLPVKVITNSKTQNLKLRVNNGEIEFYDNNNLIDLEENLIIAYSSKLDLTLADYEIDDLTDEDMKEIEQILKEHDIIGYENLNTKEKLSFDYDLDGNYETLYFISNLFDETVYNKVFAFVYYIKDGQINYLIEQVDSVENTYNLCVPSPRSIIDLDGDQHYELVIDCDYFSDIGTINKIYQLKDNSFELIN